MKIRMRCRYIAIMVVSLAAMEARAQVVTAPNVTTPVTPIPGQTPVAPTPWVVQFSLVTMGAAPPGYVGSFRAISVTQTTLPGSRGRLPTTYVVITRRPDGYSTRFKQLVNQVLAYTSTLTTYMPIQGQTSQDESIITPYTLTSMTDTVEQMQPLETLTFQYGRVNIVKVPVP